MMDCVSIMPEQHLPGEIKITTMFNLRYASVSKSKIQVNYHLEGHLKMGLSDMVHLWIFFGTAWHAILYYLTESSIE